MSNGQSKKSKQAKSTKEVNVLYQNLGGKLYAFTEIDGQIFFGKVAVQQSTKTATKSNLKPRDNKSKDA
jgi:hypothetical protein